MKTNKYPEYIMKKLRQRRGLEEDDTRQDDKISTMDKQRALDEVCNWEGLIGYGNSIRGWVEDIYDVKLNG